MKWDLLAVFLAGLGIEAWAFLALWRRGPFGRLVRLASLQDAPVNVPGGSTAIRLRLAGEVWARSDDPRAKILGALAWTMNKVRCVGEVNRRDEGKLLEAAEAGAGLGCRGMARLFSAVLATVGVESRLVALARNILDGRDTHMLVEARLEGRWVVLDPTFHAAFTGPAGEYLSAQEVKAHVFGGMGGSLGIVFLGDVAYPARHERYYMDIRQCFNNCFVADEGSPSWALKLPPILYWFGPRLYYEKLQHESVLHLELLRQCYVLIVVIAPLLLLAALLLGIRWVPA